jgi:hypothetical protein
MAQDQLRLKTFSYSMATTKQRAPVGEKRASTRSSRPARLQRSRRSGAKLKNGPTAGRWSKRVTETSNALDLEPSVFLRKDARQVARSLKRSAEHSQRRRSTPYRSAMSMLTFYINRAGKSLSPARRRTLERAKKELRSLFAKTKRRGSARSD